MNERTTRLSSSLRIRSAEESLHIVRRVARSRGVIRVVDTTWLDRIGIPVFSSIRPDGLDGNLWVHAGKGFTPAEAKIGAYMEAIEFSYAEPGRNQVTWQMSSAAEVVRSFGNRIAFADFSPLVGRKVLPDEPLAVVQAQEIQSGLGTVLIPAEHVFIPFEPPGARLYGTSTNGLASGNTLEEATVHAIAEVMERDVTSWELLEPKKSQLVRLDKAPPKVRDMAARIERAGLTPVLRYTENVFGMPHFSGAVLEPDASNMLVSAAGYGLHPVREIAAVRALSEAVQSRLTHIHGGREDVIDPHRVYRHYSADKLSQMRAAQVRKQLDDTRAIDYCDVPDFEPQLSTLADVRELLFAALARAGLHHTTRVVLSEPEFPFVIVKVVIPGAEFFEQSFPRVGPRLLRSFQHSTSLSNHSPARSPATT